MPCHPDDGGYIDSQELRNRSQVRGEGDDRPDVQIPIGPSVQAMSDPGGEGVIDGGMAQRALNADRAESPVRVEESREADDRIILE